MFREMRRKRQELTKEECTAVLERGSSGVLAVLGDGGYPYAVPLSYAYENKKLWFHCALEGHKLDAIKREEKASFCVIDQDRVIPQEYTTYFRSVIAFGRVHILEGQEKRAALEALAAKYSPAQVEGRKEEIERFFTHLCMLELVIQHMTGKVAKELLSDGRMQ